MNDASVRCTEIPNTDVPDALELKLSLMPTVLSSVALVFIEDLIEGLDLFCHTSLCSMNRSLFSGVVRFREWDCASRVIDVEGATPAMAIRVRVSSATRGGLCLARAMFYYVIYSEWETVQFVCRGYY
jgi:hypothetical protein